MTSDLALLQDYARNNVQASFTALVSRHLDLVYSAALRQVRSSQLAEEIAQSVFTDLARGAGKLKPDTNLTAWLYQVTRRTAIDVVRREARRRLREQVASEMNAMNASADDWSHIEPLLDDAMEALDETDRTAILLRYFENKPLREVGQQLGVSDDAAQKRVSRAVERLREFFSKREVKIGAGSVVTLISANAVQAAPAALAATITAAATVVGTTAATAAATTATKAIAMTTLQKTVITATLAVVAGGGIYEARQATRLRQESEQLRQQQAPLAEQVRQLKQEREEARRQLATLQEDNERLNRSTAELLELRGEVTRLRNEQRDAQDLRKENQMLLTALESRAGTVAPAPADLLEQQKRIAREKAIDGRNYATRFIMFAADNQGWFPTNWQQVATYSNAFPVSDTNDFEMVHRQLLHETQLGTNGGRTVLVREYLAWPTVDGKWAKIYGFADGHSEVVTLPDGDFSAWEKANTFSPESNSIGR